jgi:sec-independent protein translocase protein TatA
MIEYALIGPLGWQELILLFAIVLIIFGPRKLPEVAEAFGKSIQKFKKASRDARKEIDSNINEANQEENNNKN